MSSVWMISVILPPRLIFAGDSIGIWSLNGKYYPFIYIKNELKIQRLRSSKSTCYSYIINFINVFFLFLALWFNSHRTPMIAGGLFSVNKTTFDHYGRYDPQMDIWVRIKTILSLFLYLYILPLT